MKARAVCAVFLCLTLLTNVSLAAALEYQTGKIVKVAEQESNAPSGGTDAPLKAEVATYRIFIQLGNKVYVCQYHASQERDLSWMNGKEVQARVSGKTMYVKTVSGKEAKGHILSTSNSKDVDLN